MRHKAAWMGHPMRLELTRVGLLVSLDNINHPRRPSNVDLRVYVDNRVDFNRNIISDLYPYFFVPNMESVQLSISIWCFFFLQ